MYGCPHRGKLTASDLPALGERDVSSLPSFATDGCPQRGKLAASDLMYQACLHLLLMAALTGGS